jgi:putative ABC transport system permease protein
MITMMAWRNIWRNKARSLIIMFSIMLGLFAGLSVVAIYKGMMRSKIRSVIDHEVGHLQLHHQKFKEDYLAGFILQENVGLEKISQLPEIKMITRRTVTTGMLSTANGSAGITIYGIVPEEEKLISQLDRKIVEGTYFDSEVRNPILIGKKLAQKMKLKLKSKLVLMFTDSTNMMVSAAFRVAGIYESENAPLDERTAYVLHESLNTLLGIGAASHELVILLHRDEDLDKMASSLKIVYPMLQVETWQDLSPETDLMVDMVNQYSLIIIIIIMLALAFGIINTMLMAILERIREVGMLVALGMSKIRLFLLILNETIFLTLAGCPFGLLFSWITINYFSRKGMDLSIFGKDMMASFGFTNVIYPEFPFDKVLEILMIVVTTAILSSLFPAIKALRLRPVEALRK